MPQPTWLVHVGWAKEVTWGTAVAPPTTFFTTAAPAFNEKQDPIYDKGLRGIRSETQNFIFGAGHTEFDLPAMPFYPTDTGQLLMGILGFDAVSGSARTGTIATASVGAVSLTYTVVSGTAPLVGDYILIDSGTATGEIVIPTVVGGGGPYTLTVPATRYAHGAAAPATILFQHTMTVLNSGPPPSYTLARFDKLITGGVTSRQYSGCYLEEVNIKFANPGKLEVGAKGRGKLGANVAVGTPAYDAALFFAPWQGALTLGGVVNARLINADLLIKAPVPQIFGMANTQSPTAAVADQLTVTGKMTFVPDDYTEYNYYMNNTQPAASIVFTNNFAQATFQMTKCAFMDPTVLNHSGNYTAIDTTFEAISNSTDAGTGNAPLKAILGNTKATVF